MASSKRRHPEEPPSNLPPDLTFERGLPADAEAERLCLGSILLGQEQALDLSAEEFSLEKHRRIFLRILDLRDRNQPIDRVTVAGELMRQGQLESVDGLTYLASLTQDLPELSNVTGYMEIVREKARLRKIIFASQRTIDRALIAMEPADEIAASVTHSLEEVVSRPSDDSAKTAQQIVEGYPGGIGAFLDPTLRKHGLPTGLSKLDEMLAGGLHDGELIVLAARPRAGKSALALNIAHHLCLRENDPVRVDFFSLEMSAASLITRMMCAEAKVDSHKFRSGFVGRDERCRLQVGLNAIMESPLRIHDDTKTLGPMLSDMRRAIKEGTRLIILDYLQLVQTGERDDQMGRAQQLAKILRALKLMNLKYGVPQLVLSQIGRSSEKRGGSMEPQLGDLKDSGAIEETGNVVLIVHRPELYSSKDEHKGTAKVIVAKARDGDTGFVNLRFIGAWTQFITPTDDIPPEGEEAQGPEW